MNMELLTQYLMYVLFAVGALAFWVCVVVQVFKDMPILKKVQTNFVALIVALISCILAVIIFCTIYQIVVLWYYIVGAIILSFIVYIVATSGWEKLSEIWQRSKYKGSDLDEKR